MNLHWVTSFFCAKQKRPKEVSFKTSPSMDDITNS